MELIRSARTAEHTVPSSIEACRWHVGAGGALHGDYWGWCEDFAILPRASPGYLIATTVYTGGTSGGAGRLLVLPPLPATIDVFGRSLQLDERDGRVTLQFAGRSLTLAPGEAADLGAERTTVEPPIDTGHFDPGGAMPVPAEVRYRAVSYGRLDSRRIAGRST